MVGLLGTGATLILTRMNMTSQARQRDQASADAARQTRQEHYAQMAWALHRLHKYANLGYPPSRQHWVDWLDNYAFIEGVVLIVCTPSVADAVAAFSAALEAAAPDLRASLPEGPTDVAVVDDQNAWISAYRAHQAALDDARRVLLAQMPQDVGPR